MERKIFCNLCISAEFEQATGVYPVKATCAVLFSGTPRPINANVMVLPHFEVWCIPGSMWNCQGGAVFGHRGTVVVAEAASSQWPGAGRESSNITTLPTLPKPVDYLPFVGDDWGFMLKKGLAWVSHVWPHSNHSVDSVFCTCGPRINQKPSYFHCLLVCLPVVGEICPALIKTKSNGSTDCLSETQTYIRLQPLAYFHCNPNSPIINWWISG